MLALLRTDIFKREKKKGKKRKEKALDMVGVAGLSRFLRKILPKGWRFFSKPVGLDLDKPIEGWACATPPNFACLVFFIGLDLLVLISLTVYQSKFGRDLCGGLLSETQVNQRRSYCNASRLRVEQGCCR
ncbi:MAG: hypothetical protein AAF600_02960 [Bacteroidota bacterium]